MKRTRPCAVLILIALLGSPALSSDPPAASDFVGLWESRRNFGPELRGELIMTRRGESWTAEIGPHRAEVTSEGCWLSFEVPGGRGSFRGCRQATGPIVGHWTQPRTRHNGMQAVSPVVLEPVERHRWEGEVVPFEDGFTFFLVVAQREDGTVGAFLRNPDRNFGVFLQIDRLEIEGDELQLIGTWRGRGEERVLTSGPYTEDGGMFSVPIRGATYDFHRIDEDPASPFYARGKAPHPWEYHPPRELDDGWDVASLEEVGMSAEPIRDLIESIIDPPAESLHDLYVHAMLVARNGKLVLEEYFHGFHRDRSHDTRSASKSLTSFLIGAAIEAGEPVSLSLPVYETFGAPYQRADLDPRAARLTLENLLTMSSGLDCDDGDPDSAGSEDRMQEQQDNPDWYDYTLVLDMIREPGEGAVYCSANSNLAGGVVGKATGEPLEQLFQRLIAEPLDIDRYHLFLQPTGEPYMGGGIHWMPRDFLKLGQVMLDGGTWNGRRIVPKDFAARSVEPLYPLGGIGYGYQWWIMELPFRDRKVQAFFAGGNGGQMVIGIPELDLLLSFFAGNYSDREAMNRIPLELVPEYILKAVD